MLRYSLPLCFLLATIYAANPAWAQQAQSSGGGGVPRSARDDNPGRIVSGQAAQVQGARHVWTNKDIDDLRARGLLSLVGPEPGTEAAPAAAAEATATETAATPERPVYSNRFEDPEWYAQQAEAVQVQLDSTLAALAEAQQNLDAARNLRGTTGAVHMDMGNIGITPDEGIAILEEQARELQTQKDELADVARRNDIPPGVVRAAG